MHRACGVTSSFCLCVRSNGAEPNDDEMATVSDSSGQWIEQNGAVRLRSIPETVQCAVLVGRLRAE